jgi:hypothetical protein
MVSLTLVGSNPRENLYLEVQSHFANPTPADVTGSQQ